MAGEREARIGTSALLWGIFWRSVVWYTAAGAVLGGLYGCAVVVSAFLTPGLDEDGSVWALRTLVMFCTAAGFVVGWVMARAIGRQMRPLLGAVTGALAGITLGGIYLIFAYLIAFPAGAVLGGMYGLAVGLIDALQVAVVTRLLYFPLSEPAKHRRAVVLMSVLGVLIVPGYWFISSLRSSGYEGLGATTGSFWGDAFIYTGFPPLLLALVAQWLGGRLAGWYERRWDQESGDDLTWRDVLPLWLTSPQRRRRALYAAGVLVVFGALGAGTVVGLRAYQHRHVRIDLPPRGTYGLMIDLHPEDGHFTVHTDTQLQVWSLEDRRVIRSLPIHGDDVAEMSPDSNLIAVEDEFRVRLLDARDASKVATLPPVPVPRAGSFAWSPNGSMLAVLDENGGGLRLYNARSRTLLHTVNTGPSSGSAVFGPDGKILATYDDEAVKLWSVEDGRLMREFAADEYDGPEFDAVAFSPDGSLLVIGGSVSGNYAGEYDGLIILRSVADGHVLHRRGNIARSVTALAFSPDGELLATGGLDGEVGVWRASDLQLLSAHEVGHEGSVSDIAFTSGGQQVVSSSEDDHTVRLWPLPETAR